MRELNKAFIKYKRAVYIVEKLVEKAKTKDDSATGEIIEKFKYLIFKEAFKYHIPGYELEDLVANNNLQLL